ncbi:MAG: dephospho-CoA kinase, partial [Burkholderiales bacterium]|nr:dephospho-CoA kinase [Anaerolineae bacterium]
MSRWPNKFVIGLTGNIGVGKSVVRQMLQHLGAYTIDADGLSHQAMAPGAPAYKPVVETFGMFVLNEDKSINRAKLAQMVFLHPEALRRLEAITHPVVGQAINALISRSKQRVVVVEAIKLLEGELAKAVDEVWVVDAKPETQLQRLMQKRNMPEADARRRIAAQNPQADKIAKATYVINNDGNVEETWKQVQTGWNNIARKIAPPAAAGSTAPTSPSMQPVRAGEATIPSTANQTVPMRSAPASRADQAAARPLTLEVKRGMPYNAELIATFINKNAGKSVSRMDVM